MSNNLSHIFMLCIGVIYVVYIYIYIHIHRMFNLKVDRILIYVIYLIRFTTCYITQLTCIYSKCWK